MSGYINPESDANFSDFMDGEEIEDEESEEEEEEIPTLVNGKKRKNEDAAANGDGKKKKAELSPLDKALAEQKKKGKELKAPQSDADIKKAMKKAKELEKKLDKKVVEVEEDSDDDEDDDEDESDEDEEMEGEEEEDDDDEEEDDEEEDESDEEEQEEIKTPKKGKDAKSPAKQQPNGKEKTPKKGQETPAKKEAKTPKKEETASPNKAAGKTPKRTLKGGVVVEDIKVGNGPEAKRGKTIGMKYEGRLQSNNKLFDGNFNEGKAFKFRLGAGEVIKGWDVGIEGMKVGGVRRIQIPAKFGYGAQGSLPDIPPNANLVFKVECKFVS